MIRCEAAFIKSTLEAILEGGAKNSETLVLWLGRTTGKTTEVIEAYVPPQLAEFDRFQITSEGMRNVMRHLRDQRAFICAQVHSHPAEAFHSSADDEWAIVRHLGALSLVVPYFGARITPAYFLEHSAAYELSPHNKWELVNSAELPSRLVTYVNHR